MLVLTRKAGESICIGDDVEVRIVSIRGKKVRLAIEAPREMSVRRRELDGPESRISIPRLTRERDTVRTRNAPAGRRATG
jgi:carbon storage regulator